VTSFDPSAAALPGSGLYGLPHGPEEAAVHVQAVPFDATTSYRRGTASGPEAVVAASHQVDLFDLVNGRPYEAGIHLLEVDGRIAGWNEEATRAACPVIEAGGVHDGRPELVRSAAEVDRISSELGDAVRARTSEMLAAGKLPVLLGGDHATPFGAIAACLERHPGAGILHVDAHADLRIAYEGFRWSHASILHNVVHELGPEHVVQVGIRDLCEEEHEAIRSSDGRISTLYDHEWAAVRLRGGDLSALARQHLSTLPDEVYITFDVDGLDPTLCPNTGTPVPGGLLWDEAMLLLEELVGSGRRIIGLDLVEVGPGGTPDPEGQSWDAIVGARLLYRLIGAALRSRSGGAS